MAFSEEQTKALKSKLRSGHVKCKQSEAGDVEYIEGWHAISEANRIFGFDSWDRQTLTPECHWTQVQQGKTICFYSTKVRITVRAGGTITIREGIGTGLGFAERPEVAHELAIKSAETDATKRALATFGNPFGLALYDKKRSQVTRAKNQANDPEVMGNAKFRPKLSFVDASGRQREFASLELFVGALKEEIESIQALDDLYAFWSRNFAALSEALREAGEHSEFFERLVERFKAKARNLGQQKVRHAEGQGAFLLPKEKRIRDKEHLAFVASQPCLVCGRKPAVAHHLKFAQSSAMSMKVSDEFTVPLCNTHHDQLHRSSDERAWWARNGIIEPLKYAERFWASRNGQATSTGAVPRISSPSSGKL